MIWKWQSKYFALDSNDYLPQVLQTFGNDDTRLGAWIISLLPMGIFDRLAGGKIRAGITIGEIHHGSIF